MHEMVDAALVDPRLSGVSLPYCWGESAIATKFSEDRRLSEALGVNGVGVGGEQKVVWLGPSTVGVIALLARSVHGVSGKRAGILVLMGRAGGLEAWWGRRGQLHTFVLLCGCLGFHVWDISGASVLTQRPRGAQCACWWAVGRDGGLWLAGWGGVPVRPPQVHSAGSPWKVGGRGSTGSDSVPGIFLKLVPATGGIFAALQPPGSLPVRFLGYLRGRGYAAIGPLLQAHQGDPIFVPKCPHVVQGLTGFATCGASISAPDPAHHGPRMWSRHGLEGVRLSSLGRRGGTGWARVRLGWGGGGWLGWHRDRSSHNPVSPRILCTTCALFLPQTGPTAKPATKERACTRDGDHFLLLEDMQLPATGGVCLSKW